MKRAKHEVMDGCKICGRRMLTDRSTLIHRTCGACKAKQQRARNSQMAAKRKAKRHAIKQGMAAPRCAQCGKVIEGAVRLASLDRYAALRWARKFCGNACRQAAFRVLNG